jgi:hypothetical protein
MKQGQHDNNNNNDDDNNCHHPKRNYTKGVTVFYPITKHAGTQSYSIISVTF